MAKEFKLEIIFNSETKHCKLTGPINDPELCLLGLEIARRFIVDRKSELKAMTLPGMTAPKQGGTKITLPNFRELFKTGESS